MTRISFVFVFLVVAASAWADHDAGCVATGADPATMTTFDLSGRVVPLWGSLGIWYVEERGVPPPLNTDPAIPGSGFILGDGTWAYEESNGVPGLQRGGCGGLMWTPAPPPGLPVSPQGPAAANRCTPCLPFEDPCLFGVDPVNDENCGHGPDTLRY